MPNSHLRQVELSRDDLKLFKAPCMLKKQLNESPGRPAPCAGVLASPWLRAWPGTEGLRQTWLAFGYQPGCCA
ncbi:hypothetical protein SynWH8103_00475 [Synechococcus sp. WH 8103]|nr:hypothetical protein SynWH8103_00475 [Synechococcus sp. WH 8103]